jgi:hypothetical protein
LFVFSGTSLAQGTPAKAGYTEQKTQEGTIVSFGDDHLLAPDAGPYQTTVRRPPGAVRAGLLRPRFAFVAEMLKSVEHL